MPDGRTLVLPLRDLGEIAVAGLIANQAAFAVLDQLAVWAAVQAAPLRPEVVVGLPSLGHAVGAAVARALGHTAWVAPSTTRKLWYDDALSAPLRSITAPAEGANASRRMWLDPRLLPRLAGRRVLLVDDVISTGSSARAGLDLLRAAGVVPVGLAVAMQQGQRWRTLWPGAIPVVAAFATPIFRRSETGWVPCPAKGDRMETLEDFRHSLAETAPPGACDLALQALWWTGKGDWDRAHGCAQQREGDPACDLVHAHLHRVEGDAANAGYWYRRAGRPVPSTPLDAEWTAIATELLARG